MDERLTIAEVAGHGNEPTAWRILRDVSADLLDQGLTPVDPYRIAIEDDGQFHLSRTDDSHNPIGFEAPECAANPLTESGVVWSLGATVFYVVMGRQVMNGKGGRGQQKNSKLPYLRSEWPVLSELVQHCLRFDPTQRPTLQEMHEAAMQQCNRCSEEIRRGPKFKETAPKILTDKDVEPDFWPEAMQAPNMEQ